MFAMLGERERVRLVEECEFDAWQRECIGLMNEI